ncbi:MAG: hypothetical protein H7235_08965 [Bdellovibrionaceae bacterium]|nr:hypothetical protein [Pseudobdellovibrionaceae bacterium]
MKKTITTIWIAGMLAVPAQAARFDRFTRWETRAVQLMNPFALKLNLRRIQISKSIDDPANMGCIEIKNHQAQMSIGADIFKDHPGLSEDGYAAILCHELGHIFAGAPIYMKDGANLSTEGQSDYWAAAVCLKKLFRAFPEPEIKTPQASVKSNCDKVYSTNSEQQLCYRVAAAGMNAMNVLHKSLIDVIQNDPAGFYKKPDFSNHETLFSDRYPTLQCRAETFAAGAFCKTSESKWTSGSTNWACEAEISKRPGCWYK